MKSLIYWRGISGKIAVHCVYEMMTSSHSRLDKLKMMQLLESQAAQIIRDRPGLIPIDIHLETEQIVWLDIEDSSFQESFFHSSVQRLLKEKEKSIKLNTGIDFLALNDGLPNTIYPTGFIFHMSRCGSTLLSKALARSQHHVVMSEPTPLNRIWYLFKGADFQESEYVDWKMRIYKNLVLALGRQRIQQQKAYFIKFTSWNVVFLKFIKQVFPDVPCVFIYRTPAEVIASILKSGDVSLRRKNFALGAFLSDCTTQDAKKMSDLCYLERILSRFCSIILDTNFDNIIYINYNKISSQNLRSILKVLNYETSHNELKLMAEQFRFYSKIDDQNIPFIPEQHERDKIVTPEIQDCVRQRLKVLYNQLEQSPNTLSRFG